MGLLRTFGEVGDNVERIRLALEEVKSRQEDVIAIVDRLVELNDKVWDHHLRFCGQLTEKVADAQREFVDVRDELRERLEALREIVATGH